MLIINAYFDSCNMNATSGANALIVNDSRFRGSNHSVGKHSSLRLLTVFTAVRNAPLEKIALKNIFYRIISLVALFTIAAAIWTPEKNKGEAVRIRLTIPITIRLQ